MGKKHKKDSRERGKEEQPEGQRRGSTASSLLRLSHEPLSDTKRSTLSTIPAFTASVKAHESRGAHALREGDRGVLLGSTPTLP